MMEDAAARAGTTLFRQWQGGATDHQPPGHGQREGCSEGLLRAWWSKQRWLKWIRRGPFMRVWDECWLSLGWEQQQHPPKRLFPSHLQTTDASAGRSCVYSTKAKFCIFICTLTGAASHAEVQFRTVKMLRPHLLNVAYAACLHTV